MRLIVEIPAAGSEWRYVLLDDAQAAVRHGQCTPDLLPAATDVVAVVPTTQCAWHSVNLPKGSENRLREVLESLLEDQVLDDATDLHLAVLNPGDKAQSQRWVTVCNKAWLRAGLQTLQRCQRPANRVTALWLPAAGEGEAEQWLFGDAQTPVAALRSRLGAWAVDANLSLNAELATSAEPQWAAWAEEQLQRPVAIRPWYAQLARCAEPGHLARGNLAQFDLNEFGNASLLHRLQQGLAAFVFAPRWQAPRWGLLALLGINVIGLNGFAAQQQQQIAAKRVAAQQVLTQTFPEVKVVVDAPAQMQKQVALLRQRSASLGPDDFESLLGVWASIDPGAKPAPDSIIYRDRELRLRNTGAAPDTAATLNARLVGKNVQLYAEGNDWVLRAVTASTTRTGGTP